MGLFFVDGFDHYAQSYFAKKWDEISGASISTQLARNHNFKRNGCAKIIQGEYSRIVKFTNWSELQLPGPNLHPFYIGFACQIIGSVNYRFALCKIGDPPKYGDPPETGSGGALYYYPSGAFGVRGGDPHHTIGGSGSGNFLNDGKWHFIEWWYMQSPEEFTQLRFDNNTIINVLDQSPGGLPSFDKVTIGAPGTITLIDDVYMLNTGV